jgi:hypothetical protein
MNRVFALFLVATQLLALGCAGTGSNPTPVPPVPTVPGPTAGVQIQLSLGGGSKAGNYTVATTNPCRVDNPSKGAWALTATFAGQTDPSIIDLVLLEGSSYVEVFFGNESAKADDLTFNIDDRGATATLTAQGDATGPGDGASYPLQIAVECNYVARY